MEFIKQQHQLNHLNNSFELAPLLSISTVNIDITLLIRFCTISCGNAIFGKKEIENIRLIITDRYIDRGIQVVSLEEFETKKI